LSLSCNICERNLAKVLFVKNGYVLVRCASCELVYVQNPPVSEQLRRLYSFEVGYHESFRDDDKTCREQLEIGRRYYSVVRKFKHEGRILDIGCSAGFFLKVARDLNWETYGLEISEDTAGIARNRYGLEVAVGELQESTFSSNYFDVVTLWDLLEHVADPKKTLSIVNRILKDDGIVAISTPNVDGLFPKSSYKVANLLNYWPHPEPPRHLFQFSKKTLKRLLELTGFALVKIQDERIPIGYTFGPWKELLRSPMRICYSALFIPAAFVAPMLQAGDSMIAVAKKAPALNKNARKHNECREETRSR
jgi:2-polyprenyl-3-methyl-5-hydroxy-6-metoxy-1,4-benzoquinol methylase